MSEIVPELAGLPAGRVYDGELIAFGSDGLPSFRRLCERTLAGHSEVPVMFVAFDLLAEHGEPLLSLSYQERRRRLEALQVDGPRWCATVATDDGETLWQWVCERGLEGKRSRSGSPSGTGLVSDAG
jgi:bifunctional non-homologous end joining protein LigD